MMIFSAIVVPINCVFLMLDGAALAVKPDSYVIWAAAAFSIIYLCARGIHADPE